ncbi:hypothetical protein HNQ94_000947 [Salirhabdus euzebyi]|uniref:Uncharacterized protein n=1 Tax=Salirhabdus euzebyi TaxID=394506 RepID=A0A841Q259_9BACI|nr:hypothetical protein [Salirhabdus euzebyi]
MIQDFTREIKEVLKLLNSKDVTEIAVDNTPSKNIY